MSHTTDHNDLDSALRRCGSHWSGAQAHGLLCGRLVVRGTDAAAVWRDQLLEGVDAGDSQRSECEALLDELLQSTWQQLSERQSEFELMLPADAEDAVVRTQALAEWCQGFLHGVVADKHGEAVRQRLATEPLSEMIRDLLEISRATVGDHDPQTNELAYTELVEYIRVAAQLAYEELADLRPGAASAPRNDGPQDTIH